MDPNKIVPYSFSCNVKNMFSIQMGSSGGNKVMGPQVSPPNLAFQPSDPMDVILLGHTLPHIFLIANQIEMDPNKIER